MSLDTSGILRTLPNAGNVQPIGELRDIKALRSKLHPRELVDLLLSHGARAWRASQPVCHTRVKVDGYEGRRAVRVSFGR